MALVRPNMAQVSYFELWAIPESSVFVFAYEAGMEACYYLPPAVVLPETDRSCLDRTVPKNIRKDYLVRRSGLIKPSDA